MSSRSRRTSTLFFQHKPKTFLVPNMETLGQFLDSILSTFSPYANHDTFYNAVLPYQNMILIIKDPATQKVTIKGRIWFKIDGKVERDVNHGYGIHLYFIDTEDMVTTTNMSNPSNPNRNLEVKASITIRPDYNTVKKAYTFFDPDYYLYTTIGNNHKAVEIDKDYPIELYSEPTPEQREEAVMNKRLARSEFNQRPGGPEYRLQQARINEEGNFMRNSKIPPFRTRSVPTKLKSRTSSTSRNSQKSRKSRLLAKGKKPLVTRSAELPRRNRTSSNNRNGRIHRSPVVLSPPKPREFPQKDVNAFLRKCSERPGSVEPFLKQGMDPNFRNEANEPVLIIAVNHGNVIAVKQLLQSGADINATDDSGNTPLMNAILRYNLGSSDLSEIMRTLIHAEPNLRLKNNAGQNVADLLNMRINLHSQDEHRRYQWKVQKNTILNNPNW